MSRARSILVGQLWHEGHSFNPLVTAREDVAVVHGAAALAEARVSRTALAGIVSACDALGATPVPTLIARARPGGPIDEAVFQDVADRLVAAAAAGGFDAVCLDLHGATVAARTGDTEGVLLARIREAVGPEVPIAVALDLHGYITPAMLDAATILTGYRTNPHRDIFETGERAMRLLDRALREGPPRGVAVRLPFITRGNDETDRGPLVELGAIADRWRAHPGIVDVSVFNVQPFLDLPDIGQVVLAYDDGSGAAPDACRELAECLWAHRADFDERLTTVDEAFALARRSDVVLALGDQGDRVVGGGPGDSAFIAAKALGAGDLAVASGIYDPAAVAAAQAAGVGAVLDLSVGGGVNAEIAPLRATWTVAAVRDARFHNTGPYMNGVAADFGRAAVLIHGRLSVVVTSRAPNIHDPAFYETMGIPVAEQDVVVTRSANHYKLSFAGTARCITVDTPGLTAFRPADLPFTVARPFYPLDDVAWCFEEAARSVGRPRAPAPG